MCARQRCESLSNVRCEFRRRCGRTCTETYQAARYGKQVFDAVIHLLEKQHLSLLRAPLFSNISGDLRGADDAAIRAFYGGNRKRDFDAAAILPLPHRLVMVDTLAATNAIKNGRLLIVPVCRNEDHDGPADDFICPIAEEPFG